jgi:predicted MPP superfamily phosphohydrolase
MLNWMTGAAMSVALGAALAVHATRVAPYRIVLRRRVLVVPPTWPGLDILHLSDLHLRRSDPAMLRAQIRALSRLPRQPDLVCVTGDLCERVADAPLVAELLRQVSPRLGTYSILGNHEYNADSPNQSARRERLVSRVLGVMYHPVLSSGPCEADSIARALSDLGVCVLRNEGVRLQPGLGSVWLAGVDSGWARHADVPRALNGRRHDEAALALIHEPELAFAAVEHGADLVLAGHTHGGQVRLPLIGAPIWHRRDRRLRVPAGVQSIGPAQLHISAGMGQLIPLRMACPPELVWLHCVPSR